MKDVSRRRRLRENTRLGAGGQRNTPGRPVPRPARTLPASIHVDIPRTALAPACARRAVEALGELRPALTADAKLLVTELVTNSVKYGGGERIGVALRSDGPDHVHAEVVDQGAGFRPAGRDRPVTDAGGWGLHLVRTLADRWGVRDAAPGVWFEIDRSAARSAAA
jgi:anti-sigma regulatory factor (Ser/Thr protein kinase)